MTSRCDWLETLHRGSRLQGVAGSLAFESARTKYNSANVISVIYNDAMSMRAMMQRNISMYVLWLFARSVQPVRFSRGNDTAEMSNECGCLRFRCHRCGGSCNNDLVQFIYMRWVCMWLNMRLASLSVSAQIRWPSIRDMPMEIVACNCCVPISFAYVACVYG